MGRCSLPSFVRPCRQPRLFMWIAALFLAGDNSQAPARPLAVARILVGMAILLQLPETYSHLTRLLAPGTFRAPYPITPSVSSACAPILVCLMVVLATGGDCWMADQNCIRRVGRKPCVYARSRSATLQE
jgi:hypothetical protein